MLDFKVLVLRPVAVSENFFKIHSWALPYATGSGILGQGHALCFSKPLANSDLVWGLWTSTIQLSRIFSTFLRNDLSLLNPIHTQKIQVLT